MDKTTLLERIQDEYQAIMDVIKPLSEEQLHTPLTDGWSVKDNLAHLAHWEAAILPYLRAAKEGRAPEESADPTPAEEIESSNARVQQENRDRPLHDVLAGLTRTHEETIKLVAALSEEALFNPHYFPWMNGRSLVDGIAGDAYEHFAEHRETIERELREQRP
jgi:hypothetical protein